MSVGSPANGVITGIAQNLTYTPGANYDGSDSFTFKVNDGTVDSTAFATASITVTPVNDAPVAIANSGTVAEDGSVDITLTGSDLDASDSLSYTIVDAPANGTVTLVGAVATYVPAANYNGSDSFTFKVNDGTVDSAAATVSITVTPVNDAPTAIAQSVTVAEDGSVAITLTGSDLDGDSLSFVNIGSPANGVITGIAPNLTYTPGANYNGTDSFTFKVNDGTVDSTAFATVSITATSVNDAPTAVAQTVTVAEDGSLSITLAGIDLDGDSLSFVSVGSPANGVLTGIAPNLTYTPSVNYNGSDSFTFKVNDGTEDSASSATVSITVTPVNDAPTAIANSGTVAEDGSVDITLTGSDLDTSDSLSYTIVAAPANGAVTLVGAVATYVPAANYNGVDSFTFKVNDGTVDSAAATVSITVTPVNDTPIAIVQTVTVAEDGSVAITLGGSDLDGDSLSFVSVGSPANGVLTGIAPNLTYTPSANYNGTDSFTFKVNDSTVDSAAATISITVTPVNDAPTAIAQSVTVAEDGSLSITLAGSDLDGDSLSFVSVGSPANGVLTGIAPNLTYMPGANYNGADSFTFKVNDGAVDSTATAAISITVTPVNDTPLAIATSGTVAEDSSIGIALTGSDLDTSDSLSYLIVDAPTSGTVTLVGAVATYVPGANYNGADSFTFKVNDGTVDSAAATVSITVTPVNDAPTAIAQSVTVAEDGSLSITLAGSDLDGDSLSFVSVGSPANGMLTGIAPNLTYTPSANYNGPDSFTFNVNDGTVNSTAFATVSITVTPVNDAPTAIPQTVTVAEDGSVAITLAGSDLEGNGLTFVSVGSPANGVLTGIAPNLTYTPVANYNGPDSFTFKVNDGTVDSAAATVSIVVTPVADDGFAAWMASYGLVGNPQEDPDFDTISNAVEFVIGGNPKNRSDVGWLPKTSFVTADPDANLTNLDYLLFTYRRTDLAKNDDLTTIRVDWSTDLFTWTNTQGTLGVVVLESNDEAGPGVDLVRVYVPRSLAVGGRLFTRLKVLIAVPPVNNAPVAQPQNVSVNEGASLPITLTATDSNGDALSYSVATGPTHGTLTGTGRNLTYTPTAAYSGPDSFTFVANDGTVSSAPATISITVNSVSHFNLWMNGYGITAPPGADSDNDTISNAVEYVIGGNPANQSNIDLLPTISLVTADPDGNLVNADYLLFTYSRTDVANADPSASIKVEWSTGLGGLWTNSAGTPGVVTVALNNAAGPATDLVKVYIPRSLATGGSLFTRLTVSVTVP